MVLYELEGISNLQNYNFTKENCTCVSTKPPIKRKISSSSLQHTKCMNNSEPIEKPTISPIAPAVAL